MLIIAMLVVLLLVAFPTTTLGQTLRGVLVDFSARELNSISLGQTAFFCALGIAGFILVLLFETEGVKLFSFMAPDLIVWFTAFDVSLFLDAIILGLALSTASHFRPVIAPVVRCVRQVCSRVVVKALCHERAKARTPRSGVASDDPDPTGFQFAPA